MKHQFKERAIHSFFIFNNPFSVVWSVIRDSSLVIDIQANHEYYSALEPSYHCTDSGYAKGSAFWYYIEGLLSVSYEVQSVIEADYFCSVAWLCRLSNRRVPPFRCVYNLHPHGDNETLLIAEYILPFFFFEETVMMNEEVKRQLYYSSVDKFISDKEHRKKQTESIVLQGNFNNAAQLMLNVNLMGELIGKVESSSSEMTAKGDVIHLSAQTIKLLGYSMTLIVTVLEIKAANDFIYLRFSMKDTDNRICPREVMATLKYIGKSQLIFLMKHVYDAPLSDHLYKYVTSFKKKLFRRFVHFVKGRDASRNFE